MKFLRFLATIIDDILMICGLSLIVGTTFFISTVVGCYVLGFILFISGVMFTRKSGGRREVK